MLGGLTGTTFTTLPSGTYVSLLTTLPTTDGTNSGGVLDAVEWGLARVLVNTEASLTSPYWTRQGSENGGWEAGLNDTITWSAAATGALGADATILGVGVYDALTTGNLIAWEPLDSSVVVVVGLAVNIATDKIRIRMYGDVC